jgi:hypothetical protein
MTKVLSPSPPTERDILSSNAGDDGRTKPTLLIALLLPEEEEEEEEEAAAAAADGGNDERPNVGPPNNSRL